MSGSELMEEIESYTDWRPSPGSIYPLLASMQEEGLIKPHHDQDPTLKRFEITLKGSHDIEEFISHGEQFRSRNKSIRKIYWRLIREMPEDLYQSFSALLDDFEENYMKINGNASKLAELKRILDQATSELKRLGD
jgi:DNA-binding PadR family transcriptional regulator